jgi:hypothetical protein
LPAGGTRFVGTDAAAAKIAALREAPGLVEASGQIHAEMVEDDRLYATGPASADEQDTHPRFVDHGKSSRNAPS